jgi:uncharacterized protein (UPF0276 family)
VSVTAPADITRAGIGLRAPHLDAVAARLPAVGFLEIHAENHLGGGSATRKVERLRRDYAFSVHGVGLSLGSAEGIDGTHLQRIAALVERLQPRFVSEHLAWSMVDGAYLNDLLPLPYTDEALAVVARNVERMQSTLKRPVLIENPSSYVTFAESTMAEAEFLAALVARTGCGLLCDVNNIYVSGINTGFDPAAYLAALPAGAVGEIHVAGHACNDADGETILIDDHGARVADAVWALYRDAVARFGPCATLVEWDTDIPALDILLGEAARADGEARTASGRTA